MIENKIQTLRKLKIEEKIPKLCEGYVLGKNLKIREVDIFPYSHLFGNGVGGGVGGGGGG